MSEPKVLQAYKNTLAEVERQAKAMVEHLNSKLTGLKDDEKLLAATRIIIDAEKRFKEAAKFKHEIPEVKALAAKINEEAEHALAELLKKEPAKKEKHEKHDMEGDAKKPQTPVEKMVSAIEKNNAANAAKGQTVLSSTPSEKAQQNNPLMAFKASRETWKKQEPQKPAKQPGKMRRLGSAIKNKITRGGNLIRPRESRPEHKLPPSSAKPPNKAPVNTLLAALEKNKTLKSATGTNPLFGKVAPPPPPPKKESFLAQLFKKRLPFGAGFMLPGSDKRQAVTETDAYEDLELRAEPGNTRTEDVYVSTGGSSKTMTETTTTSEESQGGGINFVISAYKAGKRAEKARGKIRKGIHTYRRYREAILAARVVQAVIAIPWPVWLVIGGIILLLFLLVLFGVFSDEANKKDKCNAPVKDTLSLVKAGPTEAAAGQDLHYTFTIKDTAAANEVTIVETLPTGVSHNPADIKSSWKMTVTGNTITWKVSENVPPGALNQPYEFSFTLDLKANAPDAHLLYVINATPDRVGGTGGNKPVIVLDPGHGQESNITDPESGLIDRESANTPEREEVFEVAQKVKTQLETAGYTVVLTKNSPEEGMTHRLRATKANEAKAVLAVSIHNDHAMPYSWSEVYTQKVGLYREANGKRVEFTDAALAQKSQQYGDLVAKERATVEGRPVPLKDANFDARPGYSSGNIPLVMLFAKVPWVYNEIGAGQPGVRAPQEELDKYAQGIANGIKKAVPVNTTAPGATSPDCNPPGASPNKEWVAPAPADSCGGKYASYISRNTLLPMNYGDPACTFDKDKLRQLIEEYEKDPATGQVNQEFVNFWYVEIIPKESSFEPNAWAAPVGAQATLDAGGAWGLYQKGSSKPPGSPPPAPGKNGPLDRGDVNWEVQTKNAIEANRASGCDFWYYGSFRRSAEGQKGKVSRCSKTSPNQNANPNDVRL